MSDKDIELEIEGKKVKIPWKVILLVVGLAASVMGVQSDAFQSIIDVVN